jgi:integrase
MSSGFECAFANEIRDFVAFKRDMGFVYKTEQSYLRSLERHCAANGHSSLTKEAVESWVIARQATNPSPYGSWMSSVRELGRYMLANGNSDVYILSKRFKAKNYRPEPYLLSDAEISAFLEECALMHGRRWQAARLVMTAFFQTMYACGLRTGEARLLPCAMVDLKAGAITIADSKNHLERRLPLSIELLCFLREYDEKISLHFPDRSAFFPSPWSGSTITTNCISDKFNEIWNSTGLARPTAGRQPTPYSFRHNFAFANIHRWAKDGRDVNSLLPYLMHYMGHTSLESTYYYLHIAPDFITDYSEMVKATEALIPEVVSDE